MRGGASGCRTSNRVSSALWMFTEQPLDKASMLVIPGTRTSAGRFHHPERLGRVVGKEIDGREN